MKILLATSNPHKLEEISAVFGGTHRIVSLAQLGRAIAEPVEDQPTFEGNAMLKARYYADAAGLPCLADDSGLEVDALGGEPGVKSARYAAVNGPRSIVDPANNQLLLRKLGDLAASRRTARFVCTMALCEPGKADPLNVVRGTIEGRILGPGDAGYAIDNPAGRGRNGFGYDPLFFVASLGRTLAEVSAEEKNAVSHRGEASRKMSAWLREHRPANGTAV